jgi:hypothetical protein
MSCVKIESGWLCGPDDIVNLEAFGAKVWMEWHHYLGPTFYRSEGMIKPILTPSKKTWDAFGKWQDKKRPHRP